MPRRLETDPARSALMKRVRQSRTPPEDAVAAACRAIGLRYRRNVRSLPGSPDLANKRQRWAIFANGCFWHHHEGCQLAKVPSRNADFWSEKLAANKARDARKIEALEAIGYHVVVVWQCGTKDRDALVDRLKRSLLPPRHHRPRLSE